ncbi:MAG: hypothetical protein QOH93_3699 [Chloroflexia bacterium]|jgi:hypothetical protein|nr:hypothetical protein [Chloroflexia bacterium]
MSRMPEQPSAKANVEVKAWRGQDEVLSVGMGVVCLALLLLDLYGLRSRWHAFGTIFALTVFALVVLFPSWLLLSISALKESLDNGKPGPTRNVAIFNLAFSLVHIWLIWQVVVAVRGVLGAG